MYGGTERVVHYLTEALVGQGHEVTLFASADSATSARLSAQCRQSLRLSKDSIDQLSHHLLMIERVAKQADHFDIIHSHIDYLAFSVFRRIATPCLTTLHGRLDLPDLVPLYREFTEAPVVSISNAQRAPLPWINWQATVYHGLPQEHYHFHAGPGEYLAFVGRICPEKRVDYAIEIAKLADMPLKIAAKIDRVDREYFASVIRPLLKDPRIEYIGEIGESEKQAFLGGAMALLFPIDWPEPFGLAMIEALACGTPVISRPLGSVPEILEEGETGFIIHTAQEGARAVRNLGRISRRRCREAFERRYTAQRMAQDYVSVYERLCGAGRPGPSLVHRSHG